MTARTMRRVAMIGLAILTPLLATGSALADDPPPVHEGDPALWGPPLFQLCDDPDLARTAGYNVIEDPLGNAANPALSGGPAADAIYGLGGNDRIFGASGDDVICGGFGID